MISDRRALIADLLEERRQVEAAQKSIEEWKVRSRQRRKKRADKMACYGDLGCFEESGPYAYLEMLPSPPEEINTKFFVYSAKNR
jgi:triacylglycerol lipase